MDKKKRLLIFRIILLSSTAVSLFFVPWPLVKAMLKPVPKTLQGQVDQAIQFGFSGVIVYVDKGEQPDEAYAAGWHNKETQEEAYPEALFKIASIGKLYVAVSIAKLVEEGKLSLDDKLADFFPELKGRIEYADEITVQMLVQHRSGIPNYTNTEAFWINPENTNESNLALILDMPAKFKPGTKYAYSNTNYLLLSEIMDKVLGYSHLNYIQTEILDRLNLKNTYTSMEGVNMDSVISGYHVGFSSDTKTDEMGMLASAQDLATFVRALNDGSLFDGNEQEIYSSIYEYGHTGLVPGYQSIARYHKDIDAVVIQLTGPSHFGGYNWNLADITYRRTLRILRRSM